MTNSQAGLNGAARPGALVVNGPSRRPRSDVEAQAGPGAGSGRDACRLALAAIRPGASERDVQGLVESLRLRGVEASVYDVGAGVIVLPDVSPAALDAWVRGHPAVGHVTLPDTPYRLVRRDATHTGTRVRIGSAVIGGDGFAVIAGPCAVESRPQILDAARAVAAAGGHVLRGGAFKPRTSPYAFQGLGMEGIALLAEARAATGLPFVTEILDPGHVEAMYPHVDAFQVGARNMQNYALLRALGDVDRPVVLKRGPGATLEEWLLAAEYLLAGGNTQVVLCERGIRTFNTATRFTLDLATVALAKQATHLPVIVDPSHATGLPDLVGPMARAALAAGADGVMVEMHPAPERALSDGSQALRPAELAGLVVDLAALAPVVGRRLEPGIGARPAPIGGEG